MTRLHTVMVERTWALALGLFTLLLAANLIALPAFLGAAEIPGTLGTLAPLAIVSMANTPAVLSGGGGIDLSVAPLMGLVNVVLVTHMLGGGVLGSPIIAIPILLTLGAGIGGVNGVLITVLRFPPVIATLCMYFILLGLVQVLAPNPVVTEPNWTNNLGGSIGPLPGAVLTIGAPLLSWVLIRRTAFYENLLAVGDKDAAAYSAGVNVTAVRIVAYSLGGAVAAVAGIALTGLIRSADTSVYASYTLVGLAGLALGGTNLAGGRGGLLGSALGAGCIYLLGNLLISLHLSPVWVQAAYGALILLALISGARLVRSPAGEA